MNTSDQILLSVITPSYNRAHLLETCYESLAAQTCTDFEWIIVDDGSTDDTAEVVQGLQQKSLRFEIVYIRKENGGKHTALNAAHAHIRGKYVLILDSDDTLTPDAVEQCLKGWTRYEAVPSIGVVIFLRGHNTEDPLCYAPEEYVPVDLMSYQRVCVHSNDACEVIRTDVLRQFPFPVFPGERFLSEVALWGRISFRYQCVYINRVIYLCDYLEGGLTKAGRALRIRNPLGGMYNSNICMARKNPFKIRIKNGLLYTAYGFFAKKSPGQMARESDHKAMMTLCLPFGWLLYRDWKRKWMRPVT